MVAAEGDAAVIDGSRAQDINRRLRAKYLVPGALDAIERAWSKLDDVALELVPSKWRSWTRTSLHEEAREELGSAMSYEDAWLPDE